MSQKTKSEFNYSMLTLLILAVPAISAINGLLSFLFLITIFVIPCFVYKNKKGSMSPRKFLFGGLSSFAISFIAFMSLAAIIMIPVILNGLLFGEIGLQEAKSNMWLMVPYYVYVSPFALAMIFIPFLALLIGRYEFSILSAVEGTEETEQLLEPMPISAIFWFAIWKIGVDILIILMFAIVGAYFLQSIPTGEQISQHGLSLIVTNFELVVVPFYSLYLIVGRYFVDNDITETPAAFWGS